MKSLYERYGSLSRGFFKATRKEDNVDKAVKSVDKAQGEFGLRRLAQAAQRAIVARDEKRSAEQPAVPDERSDKQGVKPRRLADLLPRK